MQNKNEMTKIEKIMIHIKWISFIEKGPHEKQIY